MCFRSLIVSVVLSAFAAASVGAAENVNWQSKALTAGKASLTSDSYRVVRSLGTPNFSPEFRMPIELIYDSAERRTGVFGFGWRCPQLESRAFPSGRQKMEWHAPWGEKILFHEKQEITKNTIDYFKQEMRGRGYFAPFSDWEANGKEGDWAITGKRNRQGWKFIYRDSLLVRVVAPSGRSLKLSYNRNKVTAISQNETKLVELKYDKADNAVSITINGVEYAMTYAAVKVVTLPQFVADTTKRLDCAMLGSYQRGSLAPVTFKYDDYGYLNSVSQGKFTDDMKIQHETEEERLEYLKKIAAAKEQKKNGELRRLATSRKKISGRILQDCFFNYSYRLNYAENATVTIRNKAQRNAVYHYSDKRGILTVTDFSGLTTRAYYFRRYDVAYNGRLRQVCDSRDRVVVSCRYDKSSGNLVRVRDMADNEIHFEYDRQGQLSYISKLGADVDRRSPQIRIGYDSSGNPVTVSRLSADAKPAVTTRLGYNAARDVIHISNGQTSNSITYNKFGIPTRVTNCFNQSSRYDYDKFNRPTAVTAPNGVQTVYVYDANGLVTGIKRFASVDRKELLNSLSIAYDQSGQAATFTDDYGRTRTIGRNEFGKVITDVLKAGQSQAADSSGNAADAVTSVNTEYKYDVLGRLSRVLDQNGHPIVFDWNKFNKLETRKTAAGQYTDYIYDDYGLLQSIVSRYGRKGSTDRELKYTYDEFDRVIRIDYGDGRSKTFSYDSWGKLLKTEAKDGDVTKVASYAYDHFGRLSDQTEETLAGGKTTSKLAYRYAYNPWGQRTARSVSQNNNPARITQWLYDQYGRLLQIKDGKDRVGYTYNQQNQLVKRSTNGIDVCYTYTNFGQLESKSLVSPLDKRTITDIKYSYNRDGSIASRETCGVKQLYRYDMRGQLLAVVDASGKEVEKYVYDPAGNILSRTVDGKTTTYEYDKANQLVLSTADGKVTEYAYDAAGRLTKEGGKTYAYGWLDKVMSITENGAVSAKFDYHVSGQVVRRIGADNKVTSYIWDGLALIDKNTTAITNEPYVTGGNPIIAGDKVLFNDILGTTQGTTDGKEFSAIKRDAFGQTLDNDADADYDYFTGKPKVKDLGYAFLFRNYRGDLGKWQTTDPLGYPDGWNNLEYCNNGVTSGIDFLGGWHFEVESSNPPGGYVGAGMFSATDGVIVSGSMEGDIIPGDGSAFSAYAAIDLTATTGYYDIKNDEMTEHESQAAQIFNVSLTSTIIGNSIVVNGTSSASNSVDGALIPIYYDTEQGIWVEYQCSLVVHASIIGMPSGTISAERDGLVSIVCDWYYDCPVAEGYSLPQGTAIFTFGYSIKE